MREAAEFARRFFYEQRLTARRSRRYTIRAGNVRQAEDHGGRVGLQHFVVNTESNKEALAGANIRVKGFEVFLPYEVEERTHQDRRVSYMRWLFPCYLFVRFDPAENKWRSIIGARGVKGILGSSPEKPTPVPDAAISSLRAQFMAGQFRPSHDVPFPLVAGERCRVTGGTFADKVGTCLRTGPHRIAALLELFGGAVVVELPVENVTREPPEPVRLRA